MIEKLSERIHGVDTRLAVDIVVKVNELIDWINKREDKRPIAKCSADQARMDLLADLRNNGARLVSEREIELAAELLSEGLVSVRDPDGYWQITDAGRRWLSGQSVVNMASGR